MAENSKADEIISNYKYIRNNFKNGENSYTGNLSNWNIPDQPKTLTTQLIDIDKFYNVYNVVSPRVDVEFRTGPGNGDWTSLKQLVSKKGIVFWARVQYTDAQGNKKEAKKAAYQKNGKFYVDDNEVQVGDKIAAGEIIGFSQENTASNNNNNNNFFVSAIIEDTGYKTLTLELYDRTFTTIQAMLYEAIRFASFDEIDGASKTARTDTSFDLEFVKMPAATRNNIRIRYGYNEDINKMPDSKYWSQAGLTSEFYQSPKRYRWISRTFNDKDKSLGLTEGESGANLSDDQNISYDNVLYNLNNQTTILGGFEEFYITNVQSNLTNTGIKYTITAVCSDAMKLNGYKFVQKYANIVDKPKNVLASLMRCFNYYGDGDNKKANQTMVKLVWNDDRDLVPVKKILPTGHGYKAFSAEEQKDEVEKSKGALAGYKDKMIAAQSLLGCLTSEAGEEYIAGNIITQKKFYSDWKMKEKIATNWINGPNAIEFVSRESNKALWLNCFAQFRGFTPEEASKEAFLAYYLKNNGDNRLSTKLESEITSKPNAENSDGGYDPNAMYFSRIMRAVLADTMAETVYDFSNCDVTTQINEHFKAKAKQIEKIDIATEIFRIFNDYIKEHIYHDEVKGRIYIKLPADLIAALNSPAATQMVYTCYRNDSAIKITDFSNVANGWIPCPALNKWEPKSETNPVLSEIKRGDKKECEGREFYLGRLIFGLLENKVKMENFSRAIEKLEQQGKIPNPGNNEADFDADSYANIAVTLSYALGIANMTAQNDTNATLNKNNKLEDSSYVYCCFDCYKQKTYGNAKYYFDEMGENVPKIPTVQDTGEKVVSYLDRTTQDTDCREFMEKLDRACKNFKEAYNLEMASLSNSEDDNWTLLSVDEQLKKICKVIEENDFSMYKKKPLGEDKMESSFRGIDGYNGVKSGTISNDLYTIFKKIAPNGKRSDVSLCISEEEFKTTAKNITEAISKLNDKYEELNKQVSQNESAIASDEIVLSLGGPESANSGNRFYKSISSLLNEFCAACPPYRDYEAEARRKEAHDRGEKQEDIAEYTDAEGNKQSLDLRGECPTYNLTWDIIGTYTDETGSVPIVGLHYRIPRKPNKMRVYKWGNGNPGAHAIKNLSISTSSEFALLSSAANTTLEIGTGGKKIAIKGKSGEKVISGESSNNIKAIYDNYKSDKEPAFFKNVVSENDQYNITDAMFQTINKGTITLLGDPSLRFGGLINPYTYPIYLDIDLQNEGVTWSSDNRATKSTLSGVYVISKITHSLNLQGYITTIEVQRYPGINETITV